jgi:DNA-binding Xre family transcriptional regulator
MMDDKEKKVKDLVDSLYDRTQLHVEYKAKMKAILLHSIREFCTFVEQTPDIEDGDVLEWINKHVEERFKPK